MTDNHAARRRKTALLRNVGKGLVVLAMLSAAACVVVLFVQVDVIGATSTGFTTCGGAVDPVTHEPGLANAICDEQLAVQTLTALALGIVTVAAAVAGAVVLRRNPALLGF